MNTVFRITLDIHKIGSQAVIPCFQGDSGYTIIARLTENGMPFAIEDSCKAFFQAKKPDGNVLDNICVIDNNTIVYDFLTTVKNGETCQTTAVEGSVDCQFKLIGANGGILASPLFKIVVSKGVFDEGKVLPSVSEATAFTEMIVDLESKVDSGYFNGEKGEPGEDGVTPVRGEDYWTEDDKNEIVGDVLEELPARKGAGEYSVEVGMPSNKAAGARSFVGGNGATAPGDDGFSYGLLTVAGGRHAAAFNSNAKAAADDTFATGEGTFAGSNGQRVAGKFNEKDIESKYLDIVGNGTSDSDRHNAYTLDHEGNGTFSGTVRSKDGVLVANGTLFPKYEVKAVVDPTAYNDIPSEDAKLILETPPAGIMGLIYLYNPETYEESSMYLREGASYPVTLPDDFADQETAARLWKPGCQIESIYMDEGTKAYFVYSKEQTDKTAVSPTRLAEILESERPKIVEDVIAALPNAEEVSV